MFVTNQIAIQMILSIRTRSRHKHFDTETLANDIMILLLADDLQFTQKVRPICLPPTRLNPAKLAGMKGTVAGWGTLHDPGEKEKDPNLSKRKLSLVSSRRLIPMLREYDQFRASQG